jgi:hypothetical protein
MGQWMHSPMHSQPSEPQTNVALSHVSLPADEEASTYSRPLASIQYRGYEYLQLHLHFPIFHGVMVKHCYKFLLHNTAYDLPQSAPAHA